MRLYARGNSIAETELLPAITPASQYFQPLCLEIVAATGFVYVVRCGLFHSGGTSRTHGSQGVAGWRKTIATPNLILTSWFVAFGRFLPFRETV